MWRLMIASYPALRNAVQTRRSNTVCFDLLHFACSAYRNLFRRKLGLVGTAGAAAAAAGNGAGSSAATAAAANPPAAAAAAPGGSSSSERPIWPISRSASPAVLAAAAAAAAAPLDADAAVEDDSLIADLLSLMERTGADFTNTFRMLADVPMPAKSSSSSAAASNKADTAGKAAVAAAADGADAPAGAAGSDGASDDEFGGVLPLLLQQLASPSEMAAGSKPAMPLENVQVGAAAAAFAAAAAAAAAAVKQLCSTAGQGLVGVSVQDALPACCVPVGLG
jgi:uncharacterized protein YdiU (UPF0061 family)